MTAHYTLDGAGLRRAETINGLATSFDLDLAAANPTILADGTRTYLPGDPAAGYEPAGTWWYGLTTAQGTPISAVSTAGAMTPPVHLDPFGAARPGSTVAPGIGYGGEWADPTGLVNLCARAYDPAADRFTSRDSFAGYAGLPQTENRYAYGLGNPLGYVDPAGHFVNFAISHLGSRLGAPLGEPLNWPRDVTAEAPMPRHARAAPFRSDDGPASPPSSRLAARRAPRRWRRRLRA